MDSEFYKKNQRYTEILRDADPRGFQSLPRLCGGQFFHQKYVQALMAERVPGAAILDVGCGVGQVVRALAEAGFEAHGVDVSESSLVLAREGSGQFQTYDGRRLPFTDGAVDAVGTFNVLEHVGDSEVLLDEMTRVLRPGGRMVISSPNFLRIVGWRDYHPQMRGLRQKWRNAGILLRHLRAYETDPKALFFERMTPTVNKPFQPDEDAVIATNGIDFQQYLRTRNYENIQVSCVDRPIPRWLEVFLDATPLRFVILNSFVTAEKPRSQGERSS